MDATETKIGFKECWQRTQNCATQEVVRFSREAQEKLNVYGK